MAPWQGLGLWCLGLAYPLLAFPAVALPLPFLGQGSPLADRPSPLDAPSQTAQQAAQLAQQGHQQLDLGQLPAAAVTLPQALDLYRRAGDSLGMAEVLTMLGELYKFQGRYPQAIDALKQVQDLPPGSNPTSADQGRYRQAVARALTQLGDVYSFLGRPQEAMQVSNQALTMHQTLGDALDQAATLRILGAIQNGLGNYTQALELLQQALALEQPLNNPREVGRTLNLMGIVYRNQGDYDKAKTLHQQALEIAQKLGDRLRQSISLNSFGALYYSLGDYGQALKLAQQGLELQQQLGARAAEGAAWNTLGLIYDGLGQYAQALKAYQQALQIAQETGSRDLEETNLNNIGGIHYGLGEYEQALKVYQQALPIAQAIGDRRGMARLFHNRGDAYIQLGLVPQALTQYQLALDLRREIGDRAGEAQTLDSMGSLYQQQGKSSQAVNLYQQSLGVRRAIGDRAGEAAVLNNLGEIYRKQADYASALALYRLSLGVFQLIGDQVGVGTVLSNMGRVLVQTNHLSEAATTLLEGLTALESQRRGLSDGNKVAIFELQARSYGLLQFVLATQGEVNRALEIAERGRARAFLERLNRRLTLPGTPVLETSPPPTIAEIQAIAQAQQATLVEYAIVRSDLLLIWVIQPTGAITMKAVTLPANFVSLIATVRCFDDLNCQQQATGRGTATASPGSPGVPPKPPGPQPNSGGFNIEAQQQRVTQSQQELALSLSQAGLQELYQLLIDPIAPLLPSDPQAPVILIPQGELFLVPFAALRDGQGRYLLETHTLLTAPSIQVLALTHQQRQRLAQRWLTVGSGSDAALVVGNPKMPSIGEPPTPLPPLPGTEVEAQAIAALFQVPPLLGAQATKTRVLQRMAQARWIHLATHGLLETFNQVGIPGAIALAPDPSLPDQPGQVNGLLTANDILDLSLQAELVVLSACNTGRGRITGDGVLGLSRAFMTAGVPTVMVSLWQVPDAPTAALMTQFYQNLRQNPDKAGALRQAMLKVLKEYPNPQAWAGFILMGEAR